MTNESAMANLEKSLHDYFLVYNHSADGQKEECNEIRNITSCITCEENWKIFIDQSFDNGLLKVHFSSLSEEIRIKILKFGIYCMICFVQRNFTGPDLDKEIEAFLNGEIFLNINFAKCLSINNEDINVNTQFPVLLVTAKIIFESCVVDNNINNWWYWRSIIIHQEVLDESSPTLLSDADKIYKKFLCDPEMNANIKASLDIEVAQLYLIFRNISKAKEHIVVASKLLGIKYNLIGKLGKRTKFQEKNIPQLSLEVTTANSIESSEGDSNMPENVPLNDNCLLEAIEFTEVGKKVQLTTAQQKLFITIVREILISKPQDELQNEEIQPFLNMILSLDKNSYAVRVVAMLLRCKLESKNSRTSERALGQCEEIINSLKKPDPPVFNRICDLFGSGMPPLWKIDTQYANLLLNMGLVKNALEIYSRIHLWEEVIVCYTVLKLKHKAAEIIQEQLNEKPTVKLWCLLGDATDDIKCYEKAWELSKRRSHRVQRHWGQYLFVRKQFAECIPHFERSVSINPLQSSVWFRLGYAALQAENWQTAATAYRRYTTLEPDGFEAWNNLAQAYIKIGNKRNAHQAILEALKCNYENWKVWENLLVVSCDITHISDVLRAYHMLIDIKQKYLNVEVLNILVYAVCNDVNDIEGLPAQRFLQKTRELLGRVTAIYPGQGYIWELYANLAPIVLLRAQRLQRAYRCYTQGTWDKNPSTCQQVLYVCIKLADIVLENNIDPKDTIVNSIRLNLNSAVTAIKKQDFEEIKELVEQVSSQLEKIIQKIKSIVY